MRRLAPILFLAFLVRLAAVLWLSDTVPHSDAAYYHLAARKIVEDWRFPFDRSQVEHYGRLGWWPPLYPFFLASIYAVFGVAHRAAVIAQVFLGTCVCGLVFGLGKRAADDRTGRLAALLVAVDPTYIFLTNILASENLYVFWLALGLWFVGRDPSRRTQVAAGLVLGWGALTRAIGLGVPWIVALGQRRKVAAWLVGASLAAVLPWTLRNAIVAGSPALVCFGGGLNFYYGHNAQGPGYRDLSQTPMAHLTTQSGIDRMGYRLGFEHLAKAPVGFLSRGARKVASLFGSAAYAPHANSAILLPDGWQTDPEKGRQAAALRAKQRAKNRHLDGVFTWLANAHFILLCAGTLAAALAWRRMPPFLRLCTFLVVYWIGSHVVFWAQPRFRYPMEIPMALLTAWIVTTRLPRRSLVLLALLLACAPGKSRQLPPIEPWGNAGQMYGDTLEAAALNALGPLPASPLFEPISLEESFLLEYKERGMREGFAAGLIRISMDSRKFRGVDSLPPLLAAVHTAPFWVRGYEEVARVLADRGAWPRAHAIARQGLRLDATSTPLWTTLGRVYIHRRDDRRAIAALECALELDPALAPVRENLTLLYARTGQIGRADSLLREAPDDGSPSIRAFVESQVALAAGDVVTARELLARAASDPDVPAAIHVAWGNAEFEVGRLEPATRAYERALALEPDAIAALNGMAIVRRARGDLAGAAELLQRITARVPADTIAQFNLAGIGLDLSQRLSGTRADSFAAVAEEAFSVCIEHAYRTGESLERRSHLRLRRGDPVGAQDDARALMAIPEQRAAGSLLYARAALAAREPHHAVQALAPEFAADRASVDALEVLAQAYFELRDPQRAVPVLRRAHERRPDDWRITMNLGVALSQSGDHAGAEFVLRPIAEKHPREPDVLQNLAAALQRLGKRAEADVLLRRARELRQP